MKTSFILYATVLSTVTVVPLSLLPQPTYAGSSGVMQITINRGDVTISGSDNWLKDYAIPISIAMIGGVAASWSFITALRNGHYFQKLIVEELGEIKPNNPSRPTDGKLESDMQKEFIHRNILAKETENKDLILATNHKLIYHTNQLWNAFKRNDVGTFIDQLKFISEKEDRFGRKKYDKKNVVTDAYEEWKTWQSHLGILRS